MERSESSMRALLPLLAVLLVALTVGTIVRRVIGPRAEPPTVLLAP
jgi:hypothetical protein